MTTTRRKKRARRPAPRNDLGESAYAMALDLMNRLTAERDTQIGRVEFLARGLQHANEQLETSKAQLEGLRQALKLAEEERAQFEKERDLYAAKCGATLEEK